MTFKSLLLCSRYFKQKVFKTVLDKSPASWTLKFPLNNRQKFILEMFDLLTWSVVEDSANVQAKNS